MNDEQKKHIVSLFRVLVEGYKAKDWLHVHECDLCRAGAESFEKGLINRDNIYDNICPEATEAILKTSESDFIIAQLDSVIAMLLDLKREQYKPLSEEQGLKLI